MRFHRSAFAAAVLLALLAPTPGPAKEKTKEEAKDPAADINAPQPGARRIAFAAEQGTWTSVDVSPDGSTVLFDLLGDLYTVPIGGGAATRITSGPAWDSQPRYSPDGKTIAFTSDRSGTENLWLADADGKNARALTSEKDLYTRTADWTPDGEYLVARREDGKLAGIPPVELYLFNVHGGDGIQLTSSDDTHNASGPVASADGRFLYFARRQRPFNYVANLQDGLWQVARHDRKTGQVAQLTGGVGGAVRPAISPDGRTLAFVTRRDGKTALAVRDLASGAERILVGDLGRDEMEGFATADLYPGTSFTPDGRSIVFSDRGRIARVDVGTGTRTEIPFRAEVEQWAAPRVAFQDGVEKGDVRVRVMQNMAETPAGDAIVFQALGRIWKQPLAGGKTVGSPVRLTPDGSDLPTREYAPSISADGRSVAYVTWSDAALGDVWRVPIDGGVPTKLTRSAGHWANPVWSPDGKKIAALRGSGLELRGRQPEEDGSFDLLVLDATGGEASYVTSLGLSAGQIFHPHVAFLNDGEDLRLLYSEAVPGKKPKDEVKTDLVSVRLDGSDRKVHVRLPVTSEAVASPDLRWVAFTSRDEVYLAAWPPLKTAEPVELALSGGPLPVIRLSDPAGVDLHWTGDGKALTWSLADTLYRVPVARALAFVAEQKRKADAKEKGGDSEKKGAEKKDEAEEKKGLELPKADTVAVTLTAPRATPSGSFVLRNARVVTMKGDEILAAADVVVTGNRIAAVGEAGKVAVPAGAATFDASGKTVIPGLIDTHAHLHYSAFENYPETKWEYLANLAYGVTTTYDPSAPTVDVFAQGELVEAGRMVGPRIYSSGMVLYGGQATDIWAKVDDLEDARRQVKRMQAWGARMIKVYQQPRRAQRRWFAEASRQEHMLLTAEGGGELFSDLSMALDGFTAFEHSLPDELGDDAAKFLAATKTTYTPTLLVSYGGPWGELYFWQEKNAHADAKLNRFTPHFALDAWGLRHPWIEPAQYQFPIVAEGVAKVFHEGGNVSLGAHGQVQGLGPHWEIWAMAGENPRSPGAPRLTPHEALRVSTERAAEKIGLLPDLGTVEAGKLADLVVLDADPTVDIHDSTKIRWVVKNGEVYEAETMRRVWPSVVEPPHQYWQGAAGAAAASGR